MADFTAEDPPLRPRVGRARLLGRLRRGAAARALGARRHPPGEGPRGRLDRASAARAAPPSAARAACASTASRALACNTRIGEAAEARPRRRRSPSSRWATCRCSRTWSWTWRRCTGRRSGASCRGCCRPRTRPRAQEYIVPAEAMIDVTQAMACIHCGACVSACLSLEVDPEFIGPAALAKAYRFVGDPRDGEHGGAPEGPGRGPARHLRLHPLLRLRRGLPEGRGADEPDHAPAPPRHRTTTGSRTTTTATATRRRSST